MSFVERHLSKVGAQSHDLMKASLFELLRKRYLDSYERDFAQRLATTITDLLLCDQPANPEYGSFIDENESIIDSRVRELSSEEPLCCALTGAIYNSCYGKYLDSGRKFGFLFHPFLAFVRALQEVIGGKEPESILHLFYRNVGFENVEPLLNLRRLGLYRLLPHLPNSQVLMDEIIAFGESVPTDASPKPQAELQKDSNLCLIHAEALSAR